MKKNKQLWWIVLLALWGCSDLEQSSKVATLQSTPAKAGPSSGTAMSFEFSLPQDVMLRDATLVTGDSMRIADGVHVMGDTSKVINSGSGLVELGADSQMDGDVLVGGKVQLNDRVLVHGSVISNGEISMQNENTIEIEQDEIEHASQVFDKTFFWEITFPFTWKDITLEPDKSKTIAPGKYDDVIVRSRATLKLSSGTYYFESLLADANSNLELDESDGPIIIYVKDSFISRGYWIHSNNGADLMIVYHGTSKLELERPFQGTIVAPNATIRLAPLNGASYAGSFFAKRINAEARTPIHHFPFGHWEYLMPPIVTAECVSRSAQFHSAALFTIFNPLDETVEILPGDRNFIETETEKQGPLEVFKPGLQEKYYWLPFVGTELRWTLQGNTVVAGLDTRGCDLDDYTLIPIDEPQSPPQLEVLSDKINMEKLDKTNGEWTFVEETDTDYYVKKPADIGTVSNPSQWKLTITKWTLGEGFWDEIDGASKVGDQRRLWDFCDSNPASGNCNLDRDYVNSIEWGSDELAPASLTLYERDFIGDDEVLFHVDLEIDFVNEIYYRGSNEYDFGEQCFAGDYNWGMCIKIERAVPDPKLCVQWEVQLIGNVGEDEWVSTDKQLIPASFLMAKLNVDNGVQEYSPWEGYFPLDKDGCIPEDYMPYVEHMTPASGHDTVDVNLDIVGRLVYNWNDANKRAQWVILDDDEDLFHLETEHSPGTDWMDGDGLIKMTIPFNNEYTKTGAMISHIFHKQAQGEDLGIENNDIRLVATSSSHASPKNHPYFEPIDKIIYLRPDLDSNHQGVAWGDASYKFTVTHEIGHMVQYLSAAKFNNLGPNYTIKYRNERGDIKSGLQNSIVLPEACRCFTSKDRSDAHCMQSLEWPNAAIQEGFANFYAGKLWNRSDENDCWSPYTKWMYTPDCPADAECYDVNDLPDDVKDILGEYPDVNDDDGWKMVKPMVKVACTGNEPSQQSWLQWRNQFCTDRTGKDIDGDGLIDWVASEDMIQMGTEMDWMKFFRAVNVEGDNDKKWKMKRLFRIMDAAAQVDPAKVTYDELYHQGEQIYSNPKYEEMLKYFKDEGNALGVDSSI